MKKSDVVLESVQCPICLRGEADLIISSYDLIGGGVTPFKIVKCLYCGLLRTNPRPTPETIGHYYPDNYGPYMGTDVSLDHSVNKTLGKRIKQFIITLFSINDKKLPKNVVPGKLLEIGCASGAYLQEIEGNGWTVSGIEYSESAGSKARQKGFDVYIGPLENAPEPIYKFDIVVGWMVFEHLHQPVQGFSKIRRWTKDEGYLVFSIPDAGCVWAKFFKMYWQDYHLPNHLYHYDIKTLSRILQESGWMIVDVIYHRTLNSILPSVGYKLQSMGFNYVADYLINYPSRSKYLNMLLYPASFILSLVGQSGRMTVYAQKLDQ